VAIGYWHLSGLRTGLLHYSQITDCSSIDYLMMSLLLRLRSVDNTSGNTAGKVHYVQKITEFPHPVLVPWNPNAALVANICGEDKVFCYYCH
jgi:hypothetical protein